MNFQAESNSENRIKATPRGLARILSMALGFLLLFGYSPYVQAGLGDGDATAGKQLFMDNCARCHSPALEKDLTGPALMGALDRIPSYEWLYDWVPNSAAVIKSGDSYANKLYAEWNNASMDPMPHLKPEDIDNIFAWVNTYVPAGPDSGGGGAEMAAMSGDDDINSLYSWVYLLLFLIGLVLVNILFQVLRLRLNDVIEGINWNAVNGWAFIIFLLAGLFASFYFSKKYSQFYMLTDPASEHGVDIDRMFWITMAVTYSVFVITNTLLMFFAFKHRKSETRKATYYPENHRLELIWTTVPAIVLTVLVIFGIKTWNSTMVAKPDPNEPMTKIELNAQQFGWQIRYPGPDDEFGSMNVRLIDETDNILGIDFKEEVSHDDWLSNDLVFAKGRRVDLKIRSRDVLHSAYLPHFRVKMDAVPGMPTRFHFMPTKTTKEMREILKARPYWNEILEITPEGDTIRRADKFDYELACAEVCGRGHFSMRKKVIVLEQDEYDKWVKENWEDFRLYSGETDAPKDEPAHTPEPEKEHADGGRGSAMPVIAEQAE